MENEPLNFEGKYTELQRKTLACKEVEEHEDCIPIILQHFTRPSLKYPKQKKLLLHRSATTAELIHYIRKDCKLVDAREGVFLCLRSHNYILKGDRQIGSLYEKYKSKDAWLYVLYSSQDFSG